MPLDASTLVVARDHARGGIEVFFVQRQRVGFLGGAIVFPGGKVDTGDLDAAWAERANRPRASSFGRRAGSTPALSPFESFARDESELRGLAVAACREALEEAAILPVVGAVPHAELLEWRARMARGDTTLAALLDARAARLDLGALHPFARWITPTAESRRFDTRFFLFPARASLTGAHDDRETTASFWATPAEVLRRFDAGELQLAPPTHRTLEVFAAAADSRDAVRIAGASCVEAICPRLVRHRDARGETTALVLPGDPEHEVRELRSPGKSRYVLRDGRFVPEDSPGRDGASAPPEPPPGR